MPVDFESLMEPDYVRLLARTILGQDDPKGIEAFAQKASTQLLPIKDPVCFHFELSVGAVFMFSGSADERFVMKVLSPDMSIEEAQARVDFQRYLRAANYPCTEPVIDPVLLDGRIIIAERFEEPGRPADGHNPADRCVIAAGLATLNRLGSEYPQQKDYPVDTLKPVPGSMWPEPHNALFDFSRYPERTDWIDEICGRCRPFDEFDSTPVVGHVDWSAKHCRIDGGQLVMVYDWDNTALQPETRLVGGAACAFTYIDTVERQAPSFDELRAFVSEYETARGVQFQETDLEEIASSIVYAAGYTARCEDSIDFGNTDANQVARKFLRKLSTIDLVQILKDR